MKKLVRPSLCLLALLSLSSCALPPREAWRVIRQDGLIPYVAVELGHRPVPGYVHLPSAGGSRFVTAPLGPKAPQSVTSRVAGPIYVRREPGLIAGNRFLDSSPATAPQPRPPLAPAAAPAVEPKPLIASSETKPKPAPSADPKPVKHAPKPAPAVSQAPKPKPLPPAEPSKKVETTPKVVVKPKAPTEAKTQPKLPPNPVPVPNPDRIAATPAPGASTAVELPFGSPVAGRPGLVNSPFAGKNQLVDVTGLAAGQEVKCPYSGRLFRVPGVQEAKADTKPSLDAPPAKAKEKDGTPKP